MTKSWVVGIVSTWCLLGASILLGGVGGEQGGEETCPELVLAEITKGSDEAAFLKEVAEALKRLQSLPGEREIRSGLPLAGYEHVPPQELLLAYLKRDHRQAVETARSLLLRGFVKGCKRRGRTINLSELAAEIHVESEVVAALFGPSRLFASRDELKELAYKRYGDSLKSVLDTDIFDETRTAAMVDAIRRRTRLILVSAVAGAPLQKEFFQTLQKYAELKDAEIIVYPQNIQTYGLDPELLNTPGVHIVTNHIDVTPWLKINRIRLTAKQIDPITGLKRMGKRGVTQIVGHPRMRLETVATADNSLFSHKVVTTGAVTVPNYDGELEVQKRTDELADDKHVYGAVILEKMAGTNPLTGLPVAGNYHLRHIEYIEEKKGFSDLGVFYSAAGAKAMRPEYAVLGDIHVGETDQGLLASLTDQIFSLAPRYIVLHDLLNGRSISHHDAKFPLTLAQKSAAKQLDLAKELKEVVAFVNALLSVRTDHKVIIVPSNHDLWLQRWLREGTFMKDPANMALGLELAQVMVNGGDPFAYALEKFGVSNMKRVIPLKVGEMYQTDTAPFRVQLGLHGHAGANGSRAGINSIEEATDRAVFGHTHTYRRKNFIVNVGTFTMKVLPYNADGFSNWNHSLALVDSFGGIQALEYQNDQWYKPENATPIPPELFFATGFPLAIPNRVTTPGGQIDQYGGQ